MEPSDWIALAALIFSILSLIVSWQVYHRDRGHLILLIKFGGEDNQSYILNIINDGRRAVAFDQVQANIWFRKGADVYQTATILQEGERKRLLVPIPGLINVQHPLLISSFAVRDSTGSVYRARPLWQIWPILTTWNRRRHR